MVEVVVVEAGPPNKDEAAVVWGCDADVGAPTVLEDA